MLSVYVLIVPGTFTLLAFVSAEAGDEVFVLEEVNKDIESSIKIG